MSGVAQDNISSHLLRAHIATETSKKTGNPYYQLVQVWHRPGDKEYVLKTFLNEEQKALLEDTTPLESASAL